MGLARIDPSSDYFVFFAGMLVLILVFTLALERYSPSRKSRRQVRRPDRAQSGELID